MEFFTECYQFFAHFRDASSGSKHNTMEEFEELESGAIGLNLEPNDSVEPGDTWDEAPIFERPDENYGETWHGEIEYLTADLKKRKQKLFGDKQVTTQLLWDIVEAKVKDLLIKKEETSNSPREEPPSKKRGITVK